MFVVKIILNDFNLTNDSNSKSLHWLWCHLTVLLRWLYKVQKLSSEKSNKMETSSTGNVFRGKQMFPTIQTLTLKDQICTINCIDSDQNSLIHLGNGGQTMILVEYGRCSMTMNIRSWSPKSSHVCGPSPLCMVSNLIKILPFIQSANKQILCIIWQFQNLFDLEAEVRDTKTLSAFRIVTLMLACNFGINPSSGSRDTLQTS